MSVNLERFVDLLKSRLAGPLPGEEAHEPMRAKPIGDLRPKFEHASPPKTGSVLILLYAEGDKIKFPLTLRPEYIGTHSGQVSLPGGKAEAGETAEQTALREGEEEIGVLSQHIRTIGRLSKFFVIPSNFVVTPVVGWARNKPLFIPDPVEVVKILEGSVEELVKDDAIQVKEILAAKTYPLMAPHFLIENEVVWGATAMILNEFRLLLREVIKDT